MTLLPLLSLIGALSLFACGDKDGDTGADGGAADGGGSDGGSDGGGTDGGGTGDGGGGDGGGGDGGGGDGGTGDGGGGGDGGTGDGGTGDGGTGDGGTGDGGTGDGGTGDGGTGDGGTGDGGTGDGGTGDGGTGDGGGGDGGAVTENCVNTRDDDGDGLIDCEDDDCFSHPACATTGEDCTNEVDDDGDGLIDCEDDDCARDPECTSSATCPGTDLGRDLGDALASGTIDTTTPDDFDLSCGGGGGGDLSFAWRVPADGCYTIDTVGSTVDTLLALYESCVGAELDCDDDGGGYPSSSLPWAGLAGEELLLVVSAYSSSTKGGEYVLNVNEMELDLSTVDADLGRVSGDAVAFGTFTGTETPRLTASCGSSDGGDYLMSWVVPETGTWQLDTSESTVDTTLSVWSEELCGEIDCDDDTVGLTSALELDLTAGDELVIRVAIYSSYSTPGDWTLDLNML